MPMQSPAIYGTGTTVVAIGVGDGGRGEPVPSPQHLDPLSLLYFGRAAGGVTVTWDLDDA